MDPTYAKLHPPSPFPGHHNTAPDVESDASACFFGLLHLSLCSSPPPSCHIRVPAGPQHHQLHSHHAFPLHALQSSPKFSAHPLVLGHIMAVGLVLIHHTGPANSLPSSSHTPVPLLSSLKTLVAPSSLEKGPAHQPTFQAPLPFFLSWTPPSPRPSLLPAPSCGSPPHHP